MSVFPAGIRGTPTTDVQPPGELEPPHALPLTAAVAAAAPSAAKSPSTAGLGEIWQEDDREVLIRNERGAKNNNGGAGGSGKKDRVKKVRNGGAGMVNTSPRPATPVSTTTNSSHDDTKIPPSKWIAWKINELGRWRIFCPF